MCSNKITFRLKQQIEALKGGVTAAANHLGKSRNTIYNWLEKGNAPIDQLEKLGEIGVDIHYVVTGAASRQGEMLGQTVSGVVNEMPIKYNGAKSGLNGLDGRLASIVEHYIRDENLSMITTTLDQVLSNKGIILDDIIRTQLVTAANKGFEQLAAAGRTEKFNELLQTLIDATLSESS